MKKIILLMMLIVSALTAKAQHNVIMYPSEDCVYEHFEGIFYDGPPVFDRYISTGQAQHLAMSFYNGGSDIVTLNVVVRDNLDGTVLSHDIINLHPYHISDRIESTAPQSSIGYFWDTTITVQYPTLYDFEAYWIFQARF